ncbi:MAG: VanW family protein [Lachnospiraceae bacterium]
MSQNNRKRSSSTSSGRSRARGTSSSKTARSNTSRVQSARRGSSGRKGGSDYDFKKIAIGGVLLIVMITCIVFLVKGMGSTAPDETETGTTTEPETQLQTEVMVDGIAITGMSREEAKAAILKNYPWEMSVVYNDQTYEVKNLMEGKVDTLLQEIYTSVPKSSYSLDTSGLDEAVQAEVQAVAALWDKKAKNGSISSYDAASDKFLFTGAETGLAVNQEALSAAISQALKSKSFDTVITAEVATVEPEFSEATARERYKTISTFTTDTTSNSNRNTNVRLASEKLNGTVLQPGEEFSFNEFVGERTEAKGYKSAAAYSNGEVVDEIGGGVCQVSSTLYNAVLRAGLTTTVRRSHTYEPSYVRPGTDATVSWGGPDYKFVNNSSAAIGIRASYANQKATVSIYAIPILEDGVKYSLESKKIKDIDPPAPTYEEDQTLELDVEKVKTAGTNGSYWETRLVITKNGEVISNEVNNNTTYRGHASVILRNTSGTVIATSEDSTDDVTTIDQTIDQTIEVPSDGDSTAAPSEGVDGGPGATPTTQAQTGGTSAGPGTSAQPTTAAPTTSAQPTTAPDPSAAAPTSATEETIQMITPIPGA